MDGGEHHGGLTSSESPPPLPPWVPAPPCRAVKAGLDGAGGRAKGGRGGTEWGHSIRSPRSRVSFPIGWEQKVIRGAISVPRS